MVSLRLKVLVALVAQTSLQALLLSYSKNVLRQRYNSAAVIFFVEALKVVMSFILMEMSRKKLKTNKRDIEFQPITTKDSISHQIDPENDLTETQTSIGDPPVSKLLERSLPMSVPAIIYFCQNILVYIIMEHVQPEVYSTLIQLKLLTAALVSTVLLGRSYSIGKWRALVILTMGAVLVQSGSSLCPSGNDIGASVRSDALFGGFLTLIVSCLSSLAGVYTEKVLSSAGSLSLWARNLQLGIYSMAFAVVKIFFIDRVQFSDLFKGFTLVTLIIICSEAARGLTVALVLKNADTVLKGFATSCSIILTTVLGMVLFGNSVDLSFVLGAGNVILSIFIYNDS